MLDDGWTAVTRDRSLSAQFEHTIGVTADGVEIFTLSPMGRTARPIASETRDTSPRSASRESRRPEQPHYLGHRKRLREKLLEGGADALPDYELLELLLFQAMPRGDVKPLAKELVHRFSAASPAWSRRRPESWPQGARAGRGRDRRPQGGAGGGACA